MSERAEIRYAVDPGWTTSTFIRNPGGPTYRVLHYPNGGMAFEHECHFADGSPGLICAPRLDRFTVVNPDPLTLEPSISCPGCGLHGFIRDNYWSAA